MILVVARDDMRHHLDTPPGNGGMQFVDTFTDALQRFPSCRALIYALPIDNAGIEFLQIARDEQIPAVVVSNVYSADEAVTVLRGRGRSLAVDYISTDDPEFTDKVIAALAVPGQLERSGLVVDSNAMQAYYQGEPINMTPTEVSLLRVFMRNAGKTVAYATLAYAAYNQRMSDDDARKRLKTHIFNLRKKLTEAVGRDVISTRAGHGYVLMI